MKVLHKERGVIAHECKCGQLLEVLSFGDYLCPTCRKKYNSGGQRIDYFSICFKQGDVCKTTLNNLFKTYNPIDLEIIK